MQQIQSHRDNVAWLAKLQETLLERYNVTNPGQMDDHVEKCAETLESRYGVSCALNIPDVRQHAIAARQNAEVIERTKKTVLERYGCDNVFAAKQIKNKIKDTLLERYGVEHSSQIPNVSDKRQEAYARTHDYNHPFKDPSTKEKVRNVMLQRYGVQKFWQSEEFRILSKSQEYIERRHQTMKKNNTYGKSKIEDELYKRLLEQFPLIQRQVIINGWTIDFYIPEIETYVQLDGVYWHGLDRDREIIEASTLPRDKVILSTVERDVKQNEWFTKNKKQLARFTDKQSLDEICYELINKITQ